MPATSKAQQRYMGMVHAIQTGKFRGKPSKQLLDTAATIGKTDARHFAETKHQGLPEHVKASSEFQRGMREEAEHPVATATRKEIVRDHLKENPTYYSTIAACMKKKSNCTERDPNIPTSFDARQKPLQLSGKKKVKVASFLSGFMKAAARQGFTGGQALDLLQKAVAKRNNS